MRHASHSTDPTPYFPQSQTHLIPSRLGYRLGQLIARRAFRRFLNTGSVYAAYTFKQDGLRYAITARVYELHVEVSLPHSKPVCVAIGNSWAH